MKTVSQQSTQNSQQSSQDSQSSQTQPSSISSQNTSCTSSQDSTLDSTVINTGNREETNPIVRTPSNSTLESHPTTSQGSQASSFGGGVSGNQGLFSGPEISDMSQDSKTMAWHREDKLREQNKENIPESLRLSELTRNAINNQYLETGSQYRCFDKKIP